MLFNFLTFLKPAETKIARPAKRTVRATSEKKRDELLTILVSPS